MATKTKKTSTGRYKRCSKCQARLARSSESCRHCGHSPASSVPPPPFVPTETQQMLRQLAEGAPVRSPERFDVTGRYLVIVNRDHRNLYSYLKTAFSGEAGVQVIQERRSAERRGKSGKAPVERRRRDRRRRPEGEAEVRKYGVAVVRTI
jgi:rRNA maturation protein Nop10